MGDDGRNHKRLRICRGNADRISLSTPNSKWGNAVRLTVNSLRCTKSWIAYRLTREPNVRKWPAVRCLELVAVASGAQEHIKSLRKRNCCAISMAVAWWREWWIRNSH